MLSFRLGMGMVISVLGWVSWSWITSLFSRRTKNTVNNCYRNRNKYKNCADNYKNKRNNYKLLINQIKVSKIVNPKKDVVCFKSINIWQVWLRVSQLMLKTGGDWVVRRLIIVVRNMDQIHYPTPSPSNSSNNAYSNCKNKTNNYPKPSKKQPQP